MSKYYFGDDICELGTDLMLDLLEECNPPRNFSHQQVLPFLNVQGQMNPTSNATQESSKTKSKPKGSSENVENKPKKKYRNPKTPAQGVQRGHWNIDENKRYHWFLQIHRDHFLNKHMRRSDKIFKTMEKFVICREAQQCRSHHQKMEKKHGSFSNILKALRLRHYGAGDADAVLEDMRLNGIEEQEQLISWATLESGIPEKSEEVESEKQTFNELPGGSPGSPTFIDPLEEFQSQGDHLIEALICL